MIGENYGMPSGSKNNRQEQSLVVWQSQFVTYKLYGENLKKNFKRNFQDRVPVIYMM